MNMTKISDLLAKQKTFSFEFFPPKTEKASDELFQTIRDLIPLEPSFITITYGAGGSTRQITQELALRVQKETEITVAAHLTCVNHSRGEILTILEKYHENGIENIMALRGDPPAGETSFIPHADGFPYAADLVAFIKKNCPDMCVGVAGYPEGHPDTPNRLKEMEFLKAKVNQGADFITTQLFFDNNEYFDFCERCELVGIKVPIIPGIMPVVSRKAMVRMAETSLGTKYPARLLKALARTTEDDQFAKVGTHWATQQVLELLDKGVPGIHFYTLNKSRTTLQIYDSLGMIKSSAG
jgi:methylenetetrahydrofolate reductase (NADPH)